MGVFIPEQQNIIIYSFRHRVLYDCASFTALVELLRFLKALMLEIYL